MGLSDRRVRLLCEQGKIPGVVREGRSYRIPADAVKPADGRTGRLILNLMLMQQGYPAIDVKFSDRMRYYACFDSYYKDNTAAPMVKLLAEYLAERLERYLAIIG